MSNLTPPPFHMMAQSYVSHVTSAIPPPPAYTEARRDDLAAQLEQMKAMMEQMRLDKERLEMDAKRKVEEELRKEQEQEKAVKLRHEKKELDAILHQFHVHDAELHRLYGGRAFGKREIQLLNRLHDSGETVLLKGIGFAQYIQKGDQVPTDNFTRGLGLIITNHHVYAVCYDRDIKFEEGFTVENKSTIFHTSTLYSFSEPLNVQHAKLLSGILKGYSNKYGPHRLSLWDRVASASMLYPIGMQADWIDSAKKFESILRLIPGSYKNGNWRQLDGFFGMYFNETTVELSEVPPPSL